MKRIIPVMAALVSLASCSSTQTQSKILVLYYSQTGATKAVAEEIARQTGADIATFDVEAPYDGTYDESIRRCIAEQQSGELSPVKALDVDLSQYDIVMLGYPIWFGTCARPVLSLLGEPALQGKVIVPFCTFGSGGLQSSTADIKAALPDADVREGYGVRSARVAKAPAEIERFLILAGLVEGEAEALAPFSEQAPVTEETVAIFDAACGSYFMPLGTPVTVGSRTIPAGTEYLYTACSKNAEGADVTSQIYVIVDADGSAEFTQVVR